MHRDSSQIFKKTQLEFIRLSACMQHFTQVVKWSENEWGYVQKKGLKYREEVIEILKDKIYVGILVGKPVGMFALLDDAAQSESINTETQYKSVKITRKFYLDYVFVDESHRELGLGKVIIDYAKVKGHQLGAKVLEFETLTPKLNKFYLKQGAELIGKGMFYTQPTSEFLMPTESTAFS